MFLNSLWRANARNDEGSTLIAVIGVMAVTAVVTVTVAASTIQGLGVTTSARAGVQARAAAEAGIDKAVVDLQTACVATYASTTDPLFDYTISYSMSSTTPAWIAGCAPDSAKLIKIVSTGRAKSPAASGSTASDTEVVEAIYANVQLYVEVPQVDPAVYAHTMEGVFRSFVLNSASDSISADVQIRNGNVECENGAVIDGDVVLANGYAKLDRCNVNGSVHVSQYVDVNGTGTVVDGDVIALGQGVDASSPTIRLHPGIGQINGSAFGGGNLLIEDRVVGSATANGTATSLLNVTSNGDVGGDVISTGPITVTGAVGGTASPNFVGLDPLPVPRVPDWTDIPYPTSAWDGYTVIPWSGNCSVGNTHAFWDSLAVTTVVSGNIVVDARSCGAAGLDFQNNIRSLLISGNVTFVAWKFNVDKLVIDSTSSTTRYVRFMVPDDLPDAQPTCSGLAGTITLTNEADISSRIAAMAYTPCKIISDRNYWRGQLYGGTMQFLQQAQLTFTPVGVPGVDFDASLPPVLALDGSKLGGRVSLRELGTSGG